MIPKPFHLRIDDALTLDQRVPADAEELFALTDANRAWLRRWLPWLQFCKNVNDVRWNLESALREAADGTSLALSIREHGKIVGVVGFNTLCHANRTGHIGYWLGQQFAWRGIMTKAVWALTQHGFTKLDLNRIVIAAATGNAKSRAIAERLGFPFEGIAREAECLHSRVVDHAIYAMTRSDWEQRQEARIAA